MDTTPPQPRSQWAPRRGQNSGYGGTQSQRAPEHQQATPRPVWRNQTPQGQGERSTPAAQQRVAFASRAQSDRPRDSSGPQTRLGRAGTILSRCLRR
ncbi:hypothetical protein EXIGLDRAFT_85208 [Exidia glandulosa HHB12029]|uniref:Uncharacterized protein n=1 Tax=Exidia glandulosa HHB12029 TaxID=1314781 RepID=A0A165HFB5_EXIGL|nr:hypothetical protein EXIGLDRAFT_85208 [Exidia glandulosa HHB12029]